MTLKIFGYKGERLDALEDFFFMNKILYNASELREGSNIYYITVDLDNIAAVQWLDGCVQIICDESVYTLVLGASCTEVAIDATRY